MPAIMFIVVGILFLLLPLARHPLEGAWSRVSTAAVAVTNPEVFAGRENECFVIGVPPERSHDTVLLYCDPARTIAEGQNVWYRTANYRYWVGIVSGASERGVVASLFSSARTKPFRVRFSNSPDAVMLYPAGNGSFVTELPSDSVPGVGTPVYHALANQPVGVVASTLRNESTLMQQIFVRFPFSFERLTRLEVE